METTSKRVNFTDAVIAEYDQMEPTLDEIRWSHLAACKYSVMPECIKKFMQEKADYYKDKAWAYKDKDYSSPKSTQIEINSKSDEATILTLLSGSLKAEINKLLAEAYTNGLFIPGKYKPITHLSTYKFNGENQDVPQHKAGTFDLIRQDKDYTAVYSIEVKTSIYDHLPRELHRAELVLLHVLGKDEIVAFISTEPWETRKETNYIKLGTIKNISGWRNVRVNSDWTIQPWIN